MGQRKNDSEKMSKKWIIHKNTMLSGREKKDLLYKM